MSGTSDSAGRSFVSDATATAAPAAPCCCRHFHARVSPNSQIGVSCPSDQAAGGQARVAGASAAAAAGDAPKDHHAPPIAASINAAQTADAVSQESHATLRVSANAVGGCVDRRAGGKVGAASEEAPVGDKSAAETAQ